MADARRALLLALIMALVAALWTSPNAYGQPYPQKHLRIVVGFPSGGAQDTMARLIAQKLSESLRRAVIIENWPGGAGRLAAEHVARASPDGYTLMVGTAGLLTIYPSTYERLRYSPQKDFALIAQVVGFDLVLLTDPTRVPAKDLNEFIRWGRANAGKVNVADYGAGTPSHFAIALLNRAAGLDITAVHYDSSARAMQDTIGGQTHGMFNSVASAAVVVRRGLLRAIATTGEKRSKALPEVPTFLELGYPDLEFTAWFGFIAPAGVPEVILDRLNGEIVRAVNAADVRARLEAMGFVVTGTSRAQFARLVERDTARWARAVSVAGFKASD